MPSSGPNCTHVVYSPTINIACFEYSLYLGTLCIHQNNIKHEYVIERMSDEVLELSGTWTWWFFQNLKTLRSSYATQHLLEMSILLWKHLFFNIHLGFITLNRCSNGSLPDYYFTGPQVGGWAMFLRLSNSSLWALQLGRPSYSTF